MQASILKKEGENFLLAAQLQQYKRRCAKSSTEAIAVASQLNQVLQLLAPKVQQIERARGLVLNTVKALRRLSAEAAENDGSSDHSQCTSPDAGGGGGSSTTSLWASAVGDAAAVSSTENSVPRSPGQQRNHGRSSARDHAGGGSGGPSSESSSARSKHPKLDEALELLRRERSRRMEVESKASARIKAVEMQRDSALADLEILRRQVDGLESKLLDAQHQQKDQRSATQLLHAEPPPSSSSSSQKQQLQQDVGPCLSGHRRVPSTSSIGASSRNGSMTPRAEGGVAVASEGYEMKLAKAQQQLVKQKELLVQVVRRCMTIAEESNVLRDDITRRDVVIHNLRQEQQQLQQQYLQLQQVELEHRQHEQQVIQQQAQLQQLQHLQQLRQLLQEQQTQLPSPPPSQEEDCPSPPPPDAAEQQQAAEKLAHTHAHAQDLSQPDLANEAAPVAVTTGDTSAAAAATTGESIA